MGTGYRLPRLPVKAVGPGYRWTSSPRDYRQRLLISHPEVARLLRVLYEFDDFHILPQHMFAHPFCNLKAWLGITYENTQNTFFFGALLTQVETCNVMYTVRESACIRVIENCSRRDMSGGWRMTTWAW